MKSIFIKTAKKAALESGKIVKRGFNNIGEIRFKKDNLNNVVTNIDLESENKIIAVIKKRFPDHNIYSEEIGNLKGKSDYLWIVDPLDGTTNYSLGIPCFGISIALLKKKEIILGVIYFPLTNEIYAAEKGKGARLNNKKIYVSKTNKLKKAMVAAAWWSRNITHKKRGIKVFEKIALKARKVRSINTTVFDLCRVASGQFDADICETTFLDTAAAILIIKEAGGKITDHKNQEIKPEVKRVVRIVAANKILHKEIIKKIFQTKFPK